MAAALQRAILAVSDQRLAAALQSWPAWSAGKPRVIRALESGLTNQSYLLESGGIHYVLRLNASNTRQLGLDRALELQALELASKACLAPEFVHTDSRYDFLVTEYRDGHCWRTGYAAGDEKLRALARLLTGIHGLPQVDGCLDLQQRAAHYWRSIDRCYAHDDKLVRAVRSLQSELAAIFERTAALCARPCVCHNDLLPENLLVTRDATLLALDWEYAAMGDPFFDLAVIVEGHAMDEAAALTLLTHYAGEPAQPALHRLAMLRIIYCYLDLLWQLLQCDSPNTVTINHKLERLQHKLDNWP